MKRNLRIIAVKGSNATVAEVKANGRIDMSKDSKTLGYCNCNNHVWTAAIIFCNLFILNPKYT